MERNSKSFISCSLEIRGIQTYWKTELLYKLGSEEDTKKAVPSLGERTHVQLGEGLLAWARDFC